MKTAIGWKLRDLACKVSGLRSQHLTSIAWFSIGEDVFQAVDTNRYWRWSVQLETKLWNLADRVDPRGTDIPF